MDTNRFSEIVEHFSGYLRIDQFLTRSRDQYDGEAAPQADIEFISYGDYYAKPASAKDSQINSDSSTFRGQTGDRTDSDKFKAVDNRPDFAPSRGPDAEFVQTTAGPDDNVSDDGHGFTGGAVARPGIQFTYEDGADDEVISVRQQNGSLDIDTLGAAPAGASVADRIYQAEADIASLLEVAETVAPSEGSPGTIGTIAEAQAFGAALRADRHSDPQTQDPGPENGAAPAPEPQMQSLTGDLPPDDQPPGTTDAVMAASESGAEPGEMPQADEVAGITARGISAAEPDEQDIFEEADDGAGSGEDTTLALLADQGSDDTGFGTGGKSGPEFANTSAPVTNEEEASSEPAAEKQALAALILTGAAGDPSPDGEAGPAISTPTEQEIANSAPAPQDNGVSEADFEAATESGQAPAGSGPSEPAAEGGENQRSDGDATSQAGSENLTVGLVEPDATPAREGETGPAETSAQSGGDVATIAAVAQAATVAPEEQSADDGEGEAGDSGDGTGGDDTISTVYTTGTTTVVDSAGEEPLPDLETAIAASLGGNSLSNLAELFNFKEAYQSQIILGDKITKTVIVQKNIVTDNDSITINGDGRIADLSSGENSIGNFFESQTIFYDQPLIYDGDYNTFSKFVKVNYVKGDYYDIDELSQKNFLIDTDVYVTSNLAGSAILGENSEINTASVTSTDAVYDLVIILGNRIEYNYISQTNSVIDSDTLSLTYRQSATGSPEISLTAGGNVIENQAQRIVVTNPYADQPITASIMDLVNDIHSKEENFDSEINNLSTSFKLGSTIDSILFVTGDYYTMQSIEQNNMLIDTDVAIGNFGAGSFVSALVGVDGEPVDEGRGPLVTTGGNDAVNKAVIVDVTGVFGQTFVGGYVYEDTMIYQADLLNDNDTLNVPNGLGLALGDATVLADTGPNEISISQVSTPGVLSAGASVGGNSGDDGGDYATKLADILSPDVLGGVMA